MAPLLLLSALLAIGSVNLQAKKPQTKPPTKPLLGTVQMPGDNGKIGTPYSLGPKGDELNFTVESASFHYRYPLAVNDLQVADKDHKILVLTFWVQNPQKRDMRLQWNSFRFTVVSPDDQNEEYSGYYYHPDRKERFDTTLKPAQKVKAFVPIPIHPAGPVNKLIVKRLNATPVLRYDLRGLVKPLEGPFAANGGVDIADQAEAALNTSLPLGILDWSVEKVEPVEGTVGGAKPGRDNRFVVAIVSITNNGLVPYKLDWNVVKPTLKDADGEIVPFTNQLLGMASEKPVDQQLAPKDTVRAKFLFRGSTAQKPAILQLMDNHFSKRTLVIKL